MSINTNDLMTNGLNETQAAIVMGTPERMEIVQDLLGAGMGLEGEMSDALDLTDDENDSWLGW